MLTRLLSLLQGIHGNHISNDAKVILRIDFLSHPQTHNIFLLYIVRKRRPQLSLLGALANLRFNPLNTETPFHDEMHFNAVLHRELPWFLRQNLFFRVRNAVFLESIIYDPSIYTMDHPDLTKSMEVYWCTKSLLWAYYHVTEIYFHCLPISEMFLPHIIPIF